MNLLFGSFPKRRYASQQVMTEVAIDAGLMTLCGAGSRSAKGLVCSSAGKTLVRWIWLGGMLIAFSGLVSLIDHLLPTAGKRLESSSVIAPAQ